MKKYITYILALMLAVVVSSCSKDEIPMTSTVNLAGEWMVCAYIGEEQITSQFYDHHLQRQCRRRQNTLGR